MATQNRSCIFVSGGGTGGHIYPAIAICDEIKKRDLYDIFYIGNPQNMEYGIVKEKGFNFLPVKVKGMPRQLSFSLLKWCFQLMIAVFQSLIYLLKYRPVAVFGTGGYVSAPVLIACSVFKFLHIPFMMHDCDAQPGLVTRKISPYAKCVSLAFEGAKKFINNKNVFVYGNPIREDFKTLSKSDARKDLNLEDKLTICITGGSQGAKSINNAACAILKKLSQNNIQVIFQTGRRNFEKVIETLLINFPDYEQDKNLVIRPYFSEMSKALKASDIVVSRAGSLSLSEICAVPAAPILIPYPYAAADHQRKNAQFLTDKNAAIYIEDSSLTSEVLLQNILTLVNDENLLNTLKSNAFQLANYDAVSQITDKLFSIVKKS